MSITFNQKGQVVTGLDATILLFLVLPSNFFILSYVAMILLGVLHSGVAQIPAFGFWSSACAVALFWVLTWKSGPITYGGNT